MRIEVKGRNVPVTDALREKVERRVAKVGRQVSELAELEVELRAERNPAIAEGKVAEATLRLKGTTLRASERAADLDHAIVLVCDDLARQVKRHRDLRRARRAARAASAGEGAQPAL